MRSIELGEGPTDGVVQRNLISTVLYREGTVADAPQTLEQRFPVLTMSLNKSSYLLFGILVLAAALRWAGITNPLIGHHSWRQADTAAVARNFAEEQANILYPTIDWRGTESGQVECEFPLYQYSVGMLYKVLGVDEMLGRLLSLLLSLAAIAGMYHLAKRIGGVTTGLWAAFFLAIMPLPVFLGRAMMPESLLLAACVYAVLLFMKWTDSRSTWALLLSALCLTLACLLKPPTLYLGLPLAFLALQKDKRKALARPELWAYALFIFVALGLWYSHAYRIKQDTGLTFGVWEYGSDKWGNWGLVCSWEFWDEILVQRIPQILLSYLGLPLLIIGLVRPRHSANERVFSLWFAGMFIFVILVAKGVYVHDYYLLPASIPLAYFMGKAAAWGLAAKPSVPKWARISVAICVLGTFGVSLDTIYTWLSKEDPAQSHVFQLAQAAHEQVPRDALVVAVDNGDPVLLYYAQLKGWRSCPRDLSGRWVKAHAEQGAKYILGIQEDFHKDNASEYLTRLLEQHTVITNSGSFFIVKTD